MSVNESRKADRGFTLLELMITITVAAVVLGVGVPSFMGLMQSSRATAYTNELAIALNLARSEAIRRGRVVTLCGTADGTTCQNGTDWTGGWIVTTTPAAASGLLRAWPGVAGGANAITASAASVAFQPRGGTGTIATTLTVRMPNCTGERVRHLAVNRVGHVSTTRSACVQADED